MFAIVFEVQPIADQKDRYLELAQHLRPQLEATDGFISVERFASRRRPGWMLSYSLWRDEKAVVRWRSHGEHHAIQLHGRAEIFEDYHLRVGEVTTDSDAPVAPQQRLDETEVGAARAIGMTEIAADAAAGEADIARVAGHHGLELGADALVDYDVFDSLYNPGKLLLLSGWASASAAVGWAPKQAQGLRHRRLRNVRDYGLFDRREAPQFCPLVARRRA